MAEGQPGELPPDLVEWLDERAAATGRERSEVLEQAVTAYRLVSQSNGAAAADEWDITPGELETATLFADDLLDLEEEVGDLDDRLEDVDDRLGALDDEVTEVDDRVAALGSQVSDLEADLAAHVEDLRERVVQVLRAAESKADADHEHEDLAADLGALADDLETLEERLADLETRVDEGFENAEEALEDLTDRTDDLDEKATKLAHAVVGLRRRAAELEAAEMRRSAVEELQAEGNRRGVAAADCEECGGTVRLGQLADPICPHCGSPFAGVEPARGFLGSATMLVGDRPALEGESATAEGPESVFEEDHE